MLPGLLGTLMTTMAVMLLQRGPTSAMCECFLLTGEFLVKLDTFSHGWTDLVLLDLELASLHKSHRIIAYYNRTATSALLAL